MLSCPPILFIIYNRPALTKLVFDKIRKIKPQKLFIAADGPQIKNKRDKKLCLESRKIINEVDWDCDLKLLLRKKNLGCKIGVSSAIDWFFENVDQGIILEDDCLPDKSFFGFCGELLEKYKYDERVMMIGSYNFSDVDIDESYYFSKFTHIWAWATWKRSWKHFDLNISDWPENRETNFLYNIFGNRDDAEKRKNLLDQVFSKKINAWGYSWSYAMWNKKGFNIVPKITISKNIGFSKEATHTKVMNPIVENLKYGAINFPLIHPSSIIQNKKADNIVRDSFFYPKIKNSFFKKLKGTLYKYFHF